MPSRISLKKNILWNSSGSLVYLSFQWLVNYLVVILLGFKDAGIFSLAIAISSVAFAFSLYGIRGYQVSDIARKYSDKSYILARITTCVLSIAGVMVYLGVYQYDFYTTLCIIAYLLFKVSEAYVDVYHGIIQRGMRMDFIGKSFILRGIVTNLLFIGCAIITKNLLLAIVIQAVASFILIALYDRRKVQDFYKEPNTTSLKKMLRLLIECLPLAIYVFLSNLIMSIPRINLESMKGSEVLGIYASIAIPAAIVQVVAGYIFSPILTIFAEHVDKKNFIHFYKLLFKTVFYIVAFSVVAIIGGWLFGKAGLVLLFGEKISNYTYLFVPILYISSLTALSWFIGLMLTVLREFKGLIIASAIAVVLCVGGSNEFIKLFGINGVNLILIAALILQIMIMCIFMVIKIKGVQKSIETE
jgi:O-antigen/teichoic acid export membrane protein